MGRSGTALFVGRSLWETLKLARVSAGLHFPRARLDFAASVPGKTALLGPGDRAAVRSVHRFLVHESNLLEARIVSQNL